MGSKYEPSLALKSNTLLCTDLKASITYHTICVCVCVCVDREGGPKFGINWATFFHSDLENNTSASIKTVSCAVGNNYAPASNSIQPFANICSEF